MTTTTKHYNLLLGVLAVSIAANCFFLLRLLNAGVTTTHASDELGHRQAQVAVMGALIPRLAPSMSRTELISQAKARGFDVMDKGNDGVYVGEVLFKFSGGRINSVSAN